MNCRQIDPLLDDYLDRELSPPQAAAVEAHVEECTLCRQLLEGLESLQVEARRLPRRLEPETDLWPGIAARLGRRSRDAAWRRWGGLAAAMLVLLALGLLVATLLPNRGAPSTRQQAAAAPDTDRLLRETADLAHVEDRVLATRRDLLVAIERRRGRLEPETLAAIEVSVGDLHRAIGEIRVALGEGSQSRRLHLLLADHYRRESELLKRLERL